MIKKFLLINFPTCKERSYYEIVLQNGLIVSVRLPLRTKTPLTVFVGLPCDSPNILSRRSKQFVATKSTVCRDKISPLQRASFRGCFIGSYALSPFSFFGGRGGAPNGLSGESLLAKARCSFTQKTSFFCVQNSNVLLAEEGCFVCYSLLFSLGVKARALRGKKRGEGGCVSRGYLSQLASMMAWMWGYLASVSLKSWRICFSSAFSFLMTSAYCGSP